MAPASMCYSDVQLGLSALFDSLSMQSLEQSPPVFQVAVITTQKQFLLANSNLNMVQNKYRKDKVGIEYWQMDK